MPFRTPPGSPCRRTFRRLAALTIFVAATGLAGTSTFESAGIARSAEPLPDRPNVVIVFADDLGYGDLGSYGARWPTPQLDRMAREGLRLTDFYTAAAVCSASRAALLTGCYPQRVSVLGALGPQAQHGIHPDESLLPELLKARGYATGCFGKWHLGHLPKFLPRQHGFDEYYGLPYSNDMWPEHPTDRSYPELPLIEGDITVKLNPDQRQLTSSYTDRAVDFITRHHREPFFLYVPHSMPHVPLHVSEARAGTSGQGLYADVIGEIDASVGRILDALRQHHVEHRTLVIFSSDNGPWLSYGNHAGSAGPLREGKGTTWEGGMRVPAIAWFPGQIPAGTTCGEVTGTIDILPTCARLAGAKLPAHPIDGRDIWPLLIGEPGAVSPHEAYFYYWEHGLEAVRRGRWKIHFPHPYRTLNGAAGRDGTPAPYQTATTELALFDLDQDIGEQHNVAGEHPEVVRQLSDLAEAMRVQLGDSLQNRTGNQIRPAGQN